MHWKDTVIKSEQILWKRPKIKTIKDNKLDFILTLPFTNLFEQQAKHSFFEGVRVTMEFIRDKEGEFGVSDINDFLIDCGYAEVLEDKGKETK